MSWILINLYLPGALILSFLYFRHFILVREACTENKRTFLFILAVFFIPLPHVHITIKTTCGNDIKFWYVSYLIDHFLMSFPSVNHHYISFRKCNRRFLIMSSNECTSLWGLHLINTVFFHCKFWWDVIIFGFFWCRTFWCLKLGLLLSWGRIDHLQFHNKSRKIPSYHEAHLISCI